MRAIKGLTILAFVALAAWCGYWFVGARALDRAITAGLDHVPGLEAEGHSVRGFPYRFDVTFDAPSIARNGVTWRAPFVQVFALAYKPNHLLTVFANDQFLSLAGRDIALHNEDLRASMVMQAGLDLPLERFSLVGEQLDLQLDGLTHGFDRVQFASRRTGETTHDIVALADGVFPDAALMEALDPQALWPRYFEELRVDAETEFDRPLDRHLFDGSEPQLVRLTLTGVRARWEGTDIALSGRLTPGSDGALSGDVSATITGWRDFAERLRNLGILTDESFAMLEMTLGGMETQNAGEDRLEVPLSVVAGDVRLGPLLLGTLPRLRVAAS